MILAFQDSRKKQFPLHCLRIFLENKDAKYKIISSKKRLKKILCTLKKIKTTKKKKNLMNLFLDLVENNGVEYTTTITEGENADRFQLLVKKSCRIEGANDQEIAIRNQNREIYIATPLDNLQVTVFNSLGQEVFSTKEKIFSLNGLPAGAYLIKAFGKNATQIAKIILK